MSLRSPLQAAGLLAAVLYASQASAKPFLESDPYPAASTPKPTHCVVYLDAAAEVEIPIFSDATGIRCRYDLANVSVGAHAAKLAHRTKDANFGDVTSPQSPVLNFTRPAPPVAPGGLTISPN